MNSESGRTFATINPTNGEKIIDVQEGDKVNKKLTVKFLNFQTPENFAVIHLKLIQRGQILGYFIKKDANGIVNSEDPDQTVTAPLGAV